MPAVELTLLSLIQDSLSNDVLIHILISIYSDYESDSFGTNISMTEYIKEDPDDGCESTPIKGPDT